MLRALVSVSYLASTIFLWRFQIPLAGFGFPISFLLAPIALAFIGFKIGILKRVLQVTLGILAFTLLASIQQIPSTNMERSIFTAGAFGLSVLAVTSCIGHAQRCEWKFLAPVMLVFLGVQLALQISEILELININGNQPSHYFLPIDRSPGFFAEPSHLAISFSPFILAAIGNWGGLFGGALGRSHLALALLSLLLCPSATLLPVALTASAFVYGVRLKTAVAAGFAVAFSIWAVSEQMIALMPTEIAVRVDSLLQLMVAGSFDHKTNLSALVFYAGVESMVTTIFRFPLGFGFQNMSAVFSLPDFAAYRFIVGDRNIHDGGSILFKIVTEFGVIGFCFYAMGILKIASFCRNRSSGEWAVLTFPLIAYTFRGASYFDGPIIIAISILITTMYKNRMAELHAPGHKAMKSTAGL